MKIPTAGSRITLLNRTRIRTCALMVNPGVRLKKPNGPLPWRHLRESGCCLRYSGSGGILSGDFWKRDLMCCPRRCLPSHSWRNSGGVSTGLIAAVCPPPANVQSSQLSLITSPPFPCRSSRVSVRLPKITACPALRGVPQSKVTCGIDASGIMEVCCPVPIRECKPLLCVPFSVVNPGRPLSRLRRAMKNLTAWCGKQQSTAEDDASLASRKASAA